MALQFESDGSAPIYIITHISHSYLTLTQTMASSSISSHSLILALLVSICIHSQPTSSASSPTPAPAPVAMSPMEQFLTGHNQVRAAVGVPPLSWSSDLAGQASLKTRYQKDYNSCRIADLSGTDYGANQNWASYQESPSHAVANWASGNQYYNHANNSCVPGKICGTYTQVVWRKSLQLGCSQCTCADKTTLTLCFYYPPGNVVGESPY